MHSPRHIMAEHQCAECPIRAGHDKNPRSLVGRLWRWHIDFCPGWRRYYGSLDDAERQTLKERYKL